MFIDVNGIQMYYEVCGSGRPLLLVHGNGEDHTIFNEGVKELKDRFTCYAIDSRCHGASSVTDSLHYQDMADDVCAFMDGLDLHDVLFYGFSDGGIIGLMAAMKSERITALVTSGANVSPDGVKPYLRAMIRVMDLFQNDPKLKLMLNEPHISADDLSKIKVSTLVLAGEKDLVTKEETEFIARHIKNAEMHIIAGEGHGSYIVNSTKFVRYLIYADACLR